MELPLIGGHGPGASQKQHPETSVNLYIESQEAGQPAYLQNRPGQQQIEIFGFSGVFPVDVVQSIDGITRSGTTVTVESTTTGNRYGYEVGDSVTIAGSSGGDYDGTYTITTIETDQEEFTFEIGTTPADDDPTSATVILATTGNRYDKEVRLIEAITSSLIATTYRLVIGNRIYSLSLGLGSPPTIAEETAATDRFLSMLGPVTGANLGSSEELYCDQVASNINNSIAPKVILGGTWDSTAFTDYSNTITAMDGYLIRDDSDDGGRFLYSDLYDASVQNAFSFATAEGSIDDLIAVLADRRELWLFGEWTTEVWFNAGNKDLPFRRFQGGFVETGCAAPLSAKQFDNSIAWLAQDKRGGLTVVRAGEGFQPTMISTEEINHVLYTRRDYVFNAFANVIRHKGHEFYCLTLPSKYGVETAAGGYTDQAEPVTLVYDSVSKKWFRWKSHDDLLDDDDEGRWLVTASCQDRRAPRSQLNFSVGRSFQNNTIVGGKDNSGEIYFLTDDVTVDEHYSGDQVIECERTLLVVEGPDHQRVNGGPIELVTDADAGETISVDLSYAKDSKSFSSTATRTTTAASSRLLWKSIGRARRWIFKLAQDTTSTMPVRWIRLISRGMGP